MYFLCKKINIETQLDTMTSQNADAEELMKCLEKEEERIAIEEPNR